MRPADNMEKLIKKLRYKASAETHERVFENVIKALDKSEKEHPGVITPNIWRTIMKSPMTKLAAAAAIIIAVFTISLFDSSSVAWATLAEKIEKVQSVVFHITGNVKMQGMPQGQDSKTESIAYYSSEYGVRTELYMNDKLSFIMYLNPNENIYVSVIPEQQKYIKYTDKSPEELKQIAEKDDPRIMVRDIMSSEYKHLGRDTINGIEVEGIECSGPRVMGGMFEDATARLWVERGTDYPVRIEIEGTVSSGQMEMKMVMENFQWDVDLDPALFVPEIPSDYTSHELNLPETSEGAAINGLRLYAELTDGQYPDNLALMTLMKEISEVIAKKYGIKLAEEEALAEYTDTLKDILTAGMFYAQLAGADKEAVYYGDTVSADDSGKVLLRWKVSDGVYRVIFADLSAGNFSAEELAELEK